MFVMTCFSIVGQFSSQQQETDATGISRLDEKTLDQLADDLVTLSDLPRSRWHNLIHLETIKVDLCQNDDGSLTVIDSKLWLLASEQS